MTALISGTTAHIDAGAMFGRIVAVIGASAAAAALLRRFASGFVARNPNAMTGVSVVGLLTVAIGAMHGMSEHVLGHGLQAMQLTGLAFAVNVGFQIVGFVIFSKLGTTDALTVGLVSGNRNVTLVWVVVAPWLVELPLVEDYLAASVFPIFMLPLFTKIFIARLPMKRPAARSVT
jgi:predicted Na+-dependent transporter